MVHGLRLICTRPDAHYFDRPAAMLIDHRRLQRRRCPLASIFSVIMKAAVRLSHSKRMPPQPRFDVCSLATCAARAGVMIINGRPSSCTRRTSARGRLTSTPVCFMSSVTAPVGCHFRKDLSAMAPEPCWAPGRSGRWLAGGLYCDVLLGGRCGCLFGDGHVHGQDALVVAGFDVVLIGAGRQGDRAGE